MSLSFSKIYSPVSTQIYYYLDRTDPDNISCDTPTNLDNNCLHDSCLIDATYALEIQQFLMVNNNWQFLSQSSDNCRAQNSANVDQDDPNFSGGSSDKICVGEAPHVEIEVL